MCLLWPTDDNSARPHANTLYGRLRTMSGLPRPGLPAKRTTISSMRPPAARPPLHTARGRSATPALDGRTSRAESVASQAPRKRKAGEGDEGGEETNIHVVVRCRGRNDREVRENSGVVVSTSGIKGSTVDLAMGPSALSNKTYQFDKVFSPAADQNMVFNEVVSPILDEVLGGFNCTIFAYGQTGTGKTYTMTGDISNVLPLPDAAGIIPRVLDAMFQRLEASETEHLVKCSFIELYNEELRDLLSPDDAIKLKIFDDNTKKSHATTMVQGMEECYLKSAVQGITLLRNGSHKRQVAATKCNDLSSRSHTVFTITVQRKGTTTDGQEYMNTGKLNLVDLAGSENIQRSGAENKRAAEAGLINKSLLTLGRVINALVERSSHIPYRESKLTRLLQDSLGGRTKTCIIATLSPAKSNLEETISTLDYAFRAKNIRNKPQVNQPINKKTLLKEYTAEIEKLKGELIATRQRNGIYLTQENYEEITTISESRRILSEEQRDRLDTMEAGLRTKLEEIYKLTTSLQTQKKDNEQTQLALEGTKGILEKTEIVLEHTRQNLTEETVLRRAHEKTEKELTHLGKDMISTLGKTTSAIDGLRMKIRRKSELQSQNRRNWNASQTHVVDTTRLVEDRIDEFQQQQAELMRSLSERMQNFVRDELEKLGSSQAFLQDKMEAYQSSEQEVNQQTLQSRDHMNEVLEEIKTLREDVKEKIGAGLDQLSAAAETISANIITELEAFHTQVHASYASLGRDFKTTFDDLVRELNDQQADNERLHREVLEANTTLIAANKVSQAALEQVATDEKEQSAKDHQQLLAQITALITANAEGQEKRLDEKLANVSAGVRAATVTFESRQNAHSEGVNVWSNRSRDILASVAKSRDAVKLKIKSDFAVRYKLSVSTSSMVLIRSRRPLRSTPPRSETQLPPSTQAQSRLSKDRWRIWTHSCSLSMTLLAAFVSRITLITRFTQTRLLLCLQQLQLLIPVLESTCLLPSSASNLWNLK